MATEVPVNGEKHHDPVRTSTQESPVDLRKDVENQNAVGGEPGSRVSASILM
jgi:hypothetical protein